MKHMYAVIMAGGEGARLKPYTQVIPKPLLPLGERPIVEIIVTQLKNEGFDRLVITTGYKGDLVKAYFQDGSKYGLSIEYTEEKIKMGTAGALSLISSKPREPFLIINGDILTDLSLRKFMDVHRASKAVLTIGIIKYKLEIPYGIVKANGRVLKSIEEKPSFFFDVGAGIYGASEGIFRYIPEGQPMDFPELVKTLKKHREHVHCYEITEYWKDIGIMDDFEAANREIDSWSPERLYHHFPDSRMEAAR
jgi:NDP-sugar pyrophosphorylase family protein